MDEPRPNLRRYRERQAHEELSSALGPYPYLTAAIGAGLILHAVHGTQGGPAVASAAAGVAFLGLAFGIWRAADWARRALAVVFSAGLAYNLARFIGLPGVETNRAEGSFYSLIALAFLLQFVGAESREQFAAARRHLARGRRGPAEPASEARESEPA